MIWRGAVGDMLQALAHFLQLANGIIDLVRLVKHQLPVDLHFTTGIEHRGDIIQRESRGSTERNHCQGSQDIFTILPS